MPERLREYIALQCRGARTASVEPGRRGGAGPSDAKAFVFGRHPVMIPTLNQPAQESDYSIEGEIESLLLRKNGRVLGTACVVPRPKFYDLKTPDGIPYSKIALLHGSDCLASTVIQECVRYADPAKRCRFCALGVSLSRGSTILVKTPAQLAEVAAAAKRLDKVTHVTLTSGTTAEPDRGALYLGECARAIKAASGLPVQVQFEPPEDKSVFQRLKDLGVDDVGLHIESFDQAARQRITPGKAAVSVDTYFQAFADAVAVFGANKVSTYVILGLGEDEALTLDMCRHCADMGVYPFVVPLRPLMDTFLAKAEPPDPEYLYRMYTAVGEILRARGLSADRSTAGCVRCRACSMLQFTERSGAEECLDPAEKPGVWPAVDPDPQDAVELKVAESRQEIEDYFRIRHEVFVEEQHVFTDSDMDEHDQDAIPILATVGGKAAGVVRCYHQRGGVWLGGRLAVRQEHRTGNLGALLVRKAVEVMSDRPDVRRFLATIQIQNVRFFKRLGWVCLGKTFLMHGRKHQVMEKHLERTYQ